MDETMKAEKQTSLKKSLYESMLRNAILMTEAALEVKERAQTGEKYVCHLKSLALRTSRTITAIDNTAKQYVRLSHRLVTATIRHLDTCLADAPEPELQNLRHEYERLLSVLDREILEREDPESVDAPFSINDPNNLTNLERLRNLETKQGYSEQTNNLPGTLSSRSLRAEFDEKYPDNWSKDSSLSSLSNVVNLPPVPEDVFTSFAKPVRTSSLSSLKSIRKVKLFLQRTVTSEDEESECDDHELSMSDDPTSSSEGGETRSVALSVKKVGGLCNIKEETPQDP